MVSYMRTHQYIDKQQKAANLDGNAKEALEALDTILQSTASGLNPWQFLEPKLFLPAQPAFIEITTIPKPTRPMEQTIDEESSPFVIPEPILEDYVDKMEEAALASRLWKYFGTAVLIVVLLVFNNLV